MSEYRVVIIDDEKPIVEGLKAFIDWEKEGFMVVGTAMNGLDGLYAINDLCADVVLTDIRMPLLDGNDLISQAKKQRPDCEFLVLSGYSSFDYAQRAMNDGAVCYLLKPVQEEDLLKNLRKIREKLDRRNQMLQELERLRIRLDEQHGIEGPYLLSMFANAQMTEHQVLETWNYIMEKTKSLLLCIDQLDRDEVRQGLDVLISEIKENAAEMRQKEYVICLGLIMSVYQYAAQKELLTDEIKKGLAEALTEMNTHKRLNSLNDSIGQILTQMIDLKENEQKQKGIVGDVKKYVDEHYGDNISLDFIEKKFFINASYFSFQFKKKVGKNFVEYLTDVRIEKARQLIVNSDLKIYEIGERVGYSNSRYFSQIFEKKTGLTPSVYRQLNK